MYEHQIETVLQFELGAQFNGVFARDTLPLNKKNGAYVINFDKNSEPGSHWIAVYVNDSDVEYFDSFGRKPSFHEILFFLGPTYTYNSVKLQPMLSKCCGYYCIYFLVMRNRSMTANCVVDILARSDSLFIVKNYVYRKFRWLFV